MHINDIKESYNEVLEKCSTDNLNITLLITMPSGEVEMITNPKVKEKIEYLEKTYTEDLVHSNCDKIKIVGYCIGEDSMGIVSSLCKYTPENPGEYIDINEEDDETDEDSYSTLSIFNFDTDIVELTPQGPVLL